MIFRPRTKARGRVSSGQPAFIFFIRVDFIRVGAVGTWRYRRSAGQDGRDKNSIQEYTLFGLGEVQRWSEIPPCRESNAADERDK